MPAQPAADLGNLAKLIQVILPQITVLPFKCSSQQATVTATVKITATKWVLNPLCHSDFSAVVAIFPRKIADTTKKSLTVNEALEFKAVQLYCLIYI